MRSLKLLVFVLKTNLSSFSYNSVINNRTGYSLEPSQVVMIKHVINSHIAHMSGHDSRDHLAFCIKQNKSLSKLDM